MEATTKPGPIHTPPFAFPKLKHVPDSNVQDRNVTQTNTDDKTSVDQTSLNPHTARDLFQRMLGEKPRVLKTTPTTPVPPQPVDVTPQPIPVPVDVKPSQKPPFRDKPVIPQKPTLYDQLDLGAKPKNKQTFPVPTPSQEPSMLYSKLNWTTPQKPQSPTPGTKLASYTTTHDSNGVQTVHINSHDPSVHRAAELVRPVMTTMHELHQPLQFFMPALQLQVYFRHDMVLPIHDESVRNTLEHLALLVRKQLVIQDQQTDLVQPQPVPVQQQPTPQPISVLSLADVDLTQSSSLSSTLQILGNLPEGPEKDTVNRIMSTFNLNTDNRVPDPVKSAIERVLSLQTFFQLRFSSRTLGVRLARIYNYEHGDASTKDLLGDINGNQLTKDERHCLILLHTLLQQAKKKAKIIINILLH